MKSLSRLLLCLSLIAIPSVQAAEKARPKTTAAKSTNAKTPASKARAAKTSVAKASALPAIPDATEMVVDPTPQAARILNWVTGAADNKALP